LGLLHYRPWRGELHGASASVWPIARVSLWMIFRRKLFWFLYALALLIFLMFFFGQYLLSWAETQIGETNVMVGPMRTEPRVLIDLLRTAMKLNGTAETYRNFMWYQGYMVMIVLAMAGSILVGNDFHFGSLPFYLAKPLNRWHYLGGKALAVAVFINLMTTVPALLLYLQYGLLASWRYFIDDGTEIALGSRFALNIPVNPLFFGILGYGLVLTVCLSLFLLATAACLRRTVPMLMVWTTFFVFMRLLGSALVDGLNYDSHWRLIDLWNNTYLVGNACLGVAHAEIKPLPQPPTWEAGLVLIAVSILCLIYLNLRIRAVEIVP
jgi:ABC-type transport system involved in multi-copper enzyme maturation permease subunit